MSNGFAAPESVSRIRLGQNDRFDAWLYSMLSASQTLPDLRRQYNRSWRIIMRLVRSFGLDRPRRQRLLQFCRYRFTQYVAQGTLIPSRLVKRMTNLVLAQEGGLDDPWREWRRASVGQQLQLVESPAVSSPLGAVPEDFTPGNMDEARVALDYAELVRLLCLSAHSRRWLELLRHLREHRLVVISDGTRERLNLYRVSVTFSRAWKEADCVLGKGWRCADVLLGTSHSFTRDVLCYWVDEAGFHLRLRPHAPGVRKCGEADITSHAEGIIATMRAAKAQGRTVMLSAVSPAKRPRPLPWCGPLWTVCAKKWIIF